MHSRLGCVKASQVLVAEFLAAVIAHKGLGHTALESVNVGLDLIGIIVILLIGGGSLKLLKGLVLIVLKPFQRALHCGGGWSAWSF